MNTNRRLLTPVAASVLAGLVVAVATIGSVSGDRAATKTDRFATAADSLCAGQYGPARSSECLAWSQGEMTEGTVRYVTLTSTDADAGVTTLTRVQATDEAF